MNQHPLSQLTIRSAVVRGLDIGNILACDLKKEEEDVPHVYIFKWQSGSFFESSANFDAHSLCSITVPEPALVFLAPQGEYGVHYKGGSLAGDILDDSQPQPKEPRYGGFRSVSEIGGKAYAVGLRGMVYRLDELTKWTRIDDGIPETFNIQSIHGFDTSDIYAVGRHGELWNFNGQKWTKRELPTNGNLTTVKCAGDETVYIAGHDGILVRGREDTWEFIDNEETTDDIWDLEWFEGQLYVSTMSAVYWLKEEELEPVDFGDDPPKSTYQLSGAKGVMWSIGEYDIMSLEGKIWSRVV